MCLPPTKDAVQTHTWFHEDQTANNGQAALTDDGAEHIAGHKYKPGHNTHLDNILNPFWTLITDFLPMSMAPNVVTTLGGLHCFMSYLAVWYHSPNLDQPIPDWVVAFSGFCTMAYYTFDCMDGKQARRTGNSSPLGQLFDHGFDCLCLLSHVSGTAGYIMIGDSYWFLAFQSSLQFSFFMAQWEEYYTEILTHAMGNWFGVTELNYGIGLFTIFNSFLDREQFWLSKVKDVLPATILDKSIIPDIVTDLEMRHFGLCMWFCSLSILVIGSIYRVMTHEHVVKNGLHFAAFAKFITPMMISAAPFFLPQNILFKNARHISIATGLLFSFITKKIIVFSMAKMTFAAFQLEVLPLCAVFLWIRLDKRITDEGASLVLRVLSVWYVYRLLRWVIKAIDQICKRLGIKCFTIKQSKKEM